MTPLKEEVPGLIWTQERSLWFSGVRLRSRTTVLRLSDRSLWVHSPGAPTDEVCRGLDALGEVAWIVVPNKFHHLNAAPMKVRYPQAKVVAPASVTSHNKAITIDHDVSDPQLDVQMSELKRVPLAGVPFLDETTYFHQPSGTLIAADIMMCGCAKDHWSWRWVSRVCGQYDKHKLPPDVRLRTKRGPELEHALEAMMALPVKRIMVAHADAIEDKPLAQLSSAWRFALT